MIFARPVYNMSPVDESPLMTTYYLRDDMKITDVKVTMFKWIFEPWKTGVGTAFGGDKLLGILTIGTDEGVEGHSFLGSSRQGADDFAGPLMSFLKPIIMGRNPLDIGDIWRLMWKQNRSVTTNAIGAVDVDNSGSSRDVR